MEIDIKENRAKTKTAGKTEVEKMIDRAKTTKEPPFYPELEKALLRITPPQKTEAEAHKALREPSRLLRDAVQYYNNRLVDPEKVIEPQELAIIAVAADLLHRTLEKTITDGVVGEGTAYFYRAIAALSTTIGAMGCLSRDGKSADVDFRLNPEEIEKKLDELEGDTRRATMERISEKSRRLLTLLQEATGGRVKGDIAARRMIIKGIADNDKKMIEIVSLFGDIEDAWLSYTGLGSLKTTNGALLILIVLLSHFVSRMRSEIGEDGIEIMELLHSMGTKTAIERAD